MPYIVGNNIPGYLPEEEPFRVSDLDTAKLFLVDDMLHAVDLCEIWQEDDAEALTNAAEDVNLWHESWQDMKRHGELSIFAAGRAWWVRRVD